MAIPFRENIDTSLAYANKAFPSFGGWFVLILLSALMTGGAVVMTFAMMAFLIGLIGYIDPTLMNGMTAADAELFMSLFAGGGLIFMILGLIVTLLAGFFIYGFTLRVYRGDELNFKNIGSMFWQGIVYCVIMFIYMIPVLIISELVMFGPITNMAYVIIVCTILPILLSIIFAILSINAIIRYAKEGRFGAAFQLGKICKIISNIGWLRYFGHVLLLSIIICVVELILMMIPFAGWVLLIAAMPFIIIAQAKFLGNLYESGEEADTAEAVEE